jgi:hypothetical protein
MIISDPNGLDFELGIEAQIHLCPRCRAELARNICTELHSVTVIMNRG